MVPRFHHLGTSIGTDPVRIFPKRERACTLRAAQASRRRRLAFLAVSAATLLASLSTQGGAAAAASASSFPPSSGPMAHVASHASGAARIASPLPADPTTGLDANPIFVGENPPQTPTPQYITAPAGSSAGLASPNASLPSTTCTPELLSNASFESSSSWTAHDQASSVSLTWVSNSSSGREGSGYLQTSTTAVGGSVWQDASFTPAQYDNYAGAVWVKADAVLPTPITGSLTISATGGTTDSDSTAFSVGNGWTLVSAPLYVAHGGHNGLAMTLVMNTTNATYDWDAASLENAGLVDPSFEQGGSPPSGWSMTSGAGATAYHPAGKAMDGSWFAQMNTTQQGGMYQNLSMTIAAGQSYELAAWVRADTSTNVSGYLALLGPGGNPSDATYFTASQNWSLVQVPLDIQSGSYSSLQAQLILTTLNTNIDIDGLSLVNPCLVDASMEYTDSTDWQVLWQPSGHTITYGFDTGGGEDGREWLQLHTSGEVGIGQMYSATFTANEHKQAGVWLRSHDGTQLNGDLAACADGNSPTVCGNTSFSVQNAWTWVTAPLDIPSSGSFNRLRLQIYVDTQGHNLDVDGASWAPTNLGDVLPGPPSNVSGSSAGNTGDATVTWSAPTSYQGNTVSTYNVTPFLNGVAQTAQAQTGIPSSTTNASFTGLTAKGPYVFAVTASGTYGTGAPAASAPVTTVSPAGGGDRLDGRARGHPGDGVLDGAVVQRGQPHYRLHGDPVHRLQPADADQRGRLDHLDAHQRAEQRDHLHLPGDGQQRGRLQRPGDIQRGDPEHAAGRTHGGHRNRGRQPRRGPLDRARLTG